MTNRGDRERGELESRSHLINGMARPKEEGPGVYALVHEESPTTQNNAIAFMR